MLSDVTKGRLDARLAADQRDRRVPSLVAGVVRDGALAWSAGRGAVPADVTDTQYRIGSITKSLVAVCVLRLRDEGRLDLSDRVADHVPDAPVGQATLAQLLSHASGLRAETDAPWWERAPGGDWSGLVAGIGDEPQLHRSGRRFHYSNVGFAVLGRLLEQARGVPWLQTVQRELLDPLGMSRTTARPAAPHAHGFAVHPAADVVLPEPEHDAGAMAPAGQLWATLADLGRFAAFLAGDTGDVLSADTLQEMREPLVLDDRPGQEWTGAYGLGLQLWNIGGRRYSGHGGSMPGFVAAVRVADDTGDGVVALCNSTSGFSTQLVRDLHAIAAAEPADRPDWAPSPVAPGVLELTGYWYWGAAPFLVRAGAGGALEIWAVGEGRESRFRPDGDGQWIGLDSYYAGERLRAVRGPGGEVTHLDVASFVLTRLPYDPAADVPGGVDPSGWR